MLLLLLPALALPYIPVPLALLPLPEEEEEEAEEGVSLYREVEGLLSSWLNCIARATELRPPGAPASSVFCRPRAS